MAIVVEDGTALANSESYISVAETTQYHADRGNAAWAALTSPQMEQSLRKATDYMIEEYRERWKGRRVLITQALDWPRVGVVLEDFGGSQGRNNFGSYGLFQVSFQIVPIPIARACAEFALKASTGDLAPDLGRPTIMEKVDVIEVQYQPGARQITKYRAMDNLLSPYLIGMGYVNKVTRA